MAFVDLAHPANAQALGFLGIADHSTARVLLPDEVHHFSLGTHPDLIGYLWGLGAALPRPSACVIDRSGPLLAHPGSGVIFALAGGTSTLAFRLPEPELGQAFAEPAFGRQYRYPSSTVSAAEIGLDWALVRPFAEVNAHRCARAYDVAGA